MGISIGRNRQREIYVNGYSGLKSKIPFNFSELEQLAKSKLSKNAFGYCRAFNCSVVRLNRTRMTKIKLIIAD